MSTLSIIDPHYRPKLRPGLAAEPADGRVVIVDRLRIGNVVEVTAIGFELIRRFDGERTLLQIRDELIKVTGGLAIPLDTISSLVSGLDEALFLDSPRFYDRIGGPVRKPSCLGCYDPDPVKMREQFTKLFTAPGGPGLPQTNAPKSPHGKLRAALLPHMDFVRGNVTYGWGFKELIEQTDASLFVIVGTSHYSPYRFTLTRQNFETPLGVVATDQPFIDRLEAEYGEGLFEDPFAHFPEHSIELEVVLLQFLLEGKRPFRIVPLLTGSYHDCVEEKTNPADVPDIARMVTALRTVEAACAEPVCYLISGDLAHIGPKFGDERKAEGQWLDESRKQDDAIAQQIEAADPNAYFRTIAAESDARRICGLPPTWLTLSTIKPKVGKVLHYQQFVHPEGHESVSFAAAAFYS
jgi:AmmeMemoRadiSam system protein B